MNERERPGSIQEEKEKKNQIKWKITLRPLDFWCMHPSIVNACAECINLVCVKNWGCKYQPSRKTKFYKGKKLKQGCMARTSQTSYCPSTRLYEGLEVFRMYGCSIPFSSYITKSGALWKHWCVLSTNEGIPTTLFFFFFCFIIFRISGTNLSNETKFQNILGCHITWQWNPSTTNVVFSF